MNPRRSKYPNHEQKRKNHGRRNKRQMVASQAQQGLSLNNARRGSFIGRIAPSAPARPVKRDVGLQRINDALARLATGWHFAFEASRGWRLVLKQRTVKVRADVVMLIVWLVSPTKGRSVAA